MSGKSLVQDLWQKPDWPDRSEWKEVLGPAVQWVPPHLWEENMYFKGADDLELKKITGSFPAYMFRRSGCHPVYVLQAISNFGHRLCPCSSKRQPDCSYIKKGCCLLYTESIMDRDSYILEWIEFRLPHRSRLFQGLKYMGIVPLECLQRN